MDSNGINLLRTQSVLSQEELAFLERFRVISGMIIAVVLGIGIFVGGAYLAAKFQYDRLEERRVTLARSITAQAKKQILLLSLQDRIPIIQKTIEAQYPWDTVVENLVSVVRPPFLKTLVIGDNNLLAITAQADSLEDVEVMVKEILKQTTEKKIRSPYISSMQVSHNGKIDINFSFIPIF